VLSTAKLGKKQIVGLLELAQLDAGIIAFRSDTGCKLAVSGSDDVQSPGRVEVERGYEVTDIAVLQLYCLPDQYAISYCLISAHPHNPSSPSNIIELY
jgi:hypothetical protein